MIYRHSTFWRKLFPGISRASLALIVFITNPVFAQNSEDSSLAGAEQFSPGSPVEGEGWANMYDPNDNSLKLLPYLSIEGMAVHDGDIVLGPVSDFQVPSAPAGSGVQNGVALTNLGSRWDDGIVYYDLNGHSRGADIRNAMDYLETNTSIRFIADNSVANYIIFSASNGCSSAIGKSWWKSGSQGVSIGSGCSSRGVVSHELFHTLGVFHEQSRNDRDTYVTINFGNVRSGFENNFQKAGNGAEDIGPYDYSSIMHYGKTAFSIGGDTITTIPPGISIGNRSALSDGDIQTIQTMYYTDLQLDISTSVNEVDPESLVQAVIQIKNQGDGTIGNIIAKDVKVTMPLNQSTYLDSDSNENWSCQTVGQNVECELDFLNHDPGSNSFTSTLTLDLESPASLFDMTLTPTVSSSNKDTNSSNNSDTATVTVKDLTDVAVEITTSKSSLQVGESLTVDLALENSSLVNAQQPEVQLTTPTALSYNGFSGSGWNCSASANLTTCNRASLSAGSSSDLSLTFDAVSALEDAQISVTVDSQNNDGDPTNNSRTANVDINDVTDLDLQISTAATEVKRGDAVVVSINLGNVSSTDTTDVSVVITAADALNYTGFSGNGWDCTNTATATTCTLNNLAQSVTTQLSINYEAVSAASSASIAAIVASKLEDTNTANNQASTELKISEDNSSSSSGSNGGTDGSASGGGGAFYPAWLLLLMLMTGCRLFNHYGKQKNV